MGDGFSSLRITQAPATLRHQTIEVLRSAIVEGRFKPGDRLIERPLCEMTGVSRTSIREALRQLEAEGLVKIVPNRGPIVAEVTEEEASQIYELRAALEGLAGRLFVERADEDTMAALDRAFTRLKASFEQGEPAAALSRATSDFYDVFLGGCGNDLIASTAKTLSARVVFLRSRSMAQPGRGARSIAEIERMVGAIIRRDAAVAQILCEEHVRRAHSAALAELRRTKVTKPRRKKVA